MTPDFRLPTAERAVPRWHDPCVSESRAPHEFRRGTKHMRYFRSRPWGPRGPWFSNRVGARRRWRRSDELECAITGEMTDGYGDEFAFAITAETPDVMADDMLLPVTARWPLPEQMLATAADSDHVVAVAPAPPAAGAAPERIADEVVTAHMLARQHDDAMAGRRSA